METLPALPNVGNARLPQTYSRARDALEKCSRVDECKEWHDKAMALASYAKQARDRKMLDMAVRIQARAIDRAGKLLKQIEKGTGGQPYQKGKISTRGGTPPSRTQAARDAGLSDDQRKKALRVASVPEDVKETIIEGPRPSIKKLVDLGTVHREQKNPAFPKPMGAQAQAGPFSSADVSRGDPEEGVIVVVPKPYVSPAVVRASQ